MLVVLSCLLLLLVLREALQEDPPCSRCDFSQLPAAQTSLLPSECCECALFLWQRLQWKLLFFVQWSCDSVLWQFLQRLGRWLQAQPRLRLARTRS